MGGDIIAGPIVGFWVAQNAGGSFSPDNMTAIGLEQSGRIVAGVMYENWNGRSIMAHVAVKGRMTRKFVGAIFRYPYEKCGVHKIILSISSANAKSAKLATNMGFREEARIRDADPGGDLIIYTLEKSECRFLGERYG